MMCSLTATTSELRDQQKRSFSKQCMILQATLSYMREIAQHMLEFWTSQRPLIKVPHERLLTKLDFYGIRGAIKQWIKIFLTNRSQTVVCDGATSTPKQVLSGVPQGTVLGPLLFLLYINDLPDQLQNTTRLFADDCLVYSSGKTTNHIDSLQQDLHKLEDWQDRWQMSFNPSKCSILQISTKRKPPTKPITFCGQHLEEVKSHPYLGVQLDNNISWKEHIKNTTTKAGKVLGFLQ